MLTITTTGNRVLTERVDHFTIGDRQVDLPVAGVFEVHDGAITTWHDYFDLQTYLRQAGQA